MSFVSKFPIRCQSLMTQKLAGKKIVFLLESLELGGAERQALNFALYLRDQEGATVEVWGLGPPGHMSDLCNKYEICWHSVGYKFPPDILHQTLEFVRLITKLKKTKLDVLLPYTWLPNVLCGIGWRLTGANTCIWNQRDEGCYLKPDSNKHRLAVWLTQSFISNSQHGKAFLEREFNIEPSKIISILNPVQLDPPVGNRSTWRSRLHANATDFVACMVANIHPYKDHSTAIRAWKIVSERLACKGRRALLVFAGRNDGLGYELALMVNKIGLDNEILFLGAVDDISGLLSACEIGVHSTKQEGCPNAVLEEMAAGLPVVGTDLPGNREVLGVNGDRWLAPQDDPEALAEKILQLESDSNLLHSAGEENRVRVETEFNPMKCYKTMTTAIIKSINNLPMA